MALKEAVRRKAAARGEKKNKPQRLNEEEKSKV